MKEVQPQPRDPVGPLILKQNFTKNSSSYVELIRMEAAESVNWNRSASSSIGIIGGGERKGGIARRVPWKDWEEWLFVYNSLYSEDPTSRLVGLKRISAWRARGRVPLAIESTAQFVELTLRDLVSLNEQNPLFSASSWNPLSSHRSETEKRLMYSMALIRFVNGFVDPAQKSVYAMPITHLAEKLGLPRFFVDLRHEATHNQLPSLVILQNATRVALDWLHSNYWQKQLAALFETKDELMQLLNDYRRLQKSKLTCKDKSSKSQLKEQISSCVDCIIDITTPASVKQVLIPLLLDEFYLVPKSKKFKVHEVLPERYSAIWMDALKRFCLAWKIFAPSFIYLASKNVLDNSVIDSEDKLEQKHMNYRNSTILNWITEVLNLTLSLKKFKHSPITAIIQDISSYCVLIFLSAYHNLELCIKHNDGKWTSVLLGKLGDYLMKLKSSEDENTEVLEKLKSLKRKADNIIANPFKKGKYNDEPDELSLQKFQSLLQKNTLEVLNGGLVGLNQAAESEEEEVNNCWKRCKQWGISALGSFNKSGAHMSLDLPQELDTFGAAMLRIPEPLLQPMLPQYNDQSNTIRHDNTHDHSTVSESDSMQQEEEGTTVNGNSSRAVPKVSLLFSLDELIACAKK